MNSVHGQFDVAEGDDRRSDVIECDEAALKLLVSHQQLAGTQVTGARDSNQRLKQWLLAQGSAATQVPSVRPGAQSDWQLGMGLRCVPILLA